MSKQPASTYTETLGTKLIQALIQEGKYIFTTDEARQVAEGLGIQYGFLRKLLALLEKGKWITRLKGGLYATIGSLPGEAQVHEFAIATHLVKPSAISHVSALSFHGLTEQIPVIVTASTPTSFVSPSMRKEQEKPPDSRHGWTIGGVTYAFTKIKPEHFFGIEQVWIDTRFRIPILDKERTLLDGFISPKSIGGMGEVMGLMEENLSQLDLGKLVQYALRYNKGSVIKRLGWVLETLGVDEPIFTPLKEQPVSGYHLLDPAAPKAGRYEKAWMIHNNLTGKERA